MIFFAYKMTLAIAACHFLFALFNDSKMTQSRSIDEYSPSTNRLQEEKLYRTLNLFRTEWSIEQHSIVLLLSSDNMAMRQSLASKYEQ